MDPRNETAGQAGPLNGGLFFEDRVNFRIDYLDFRGGGQALQPLSQVQIDWLLNNGVAIGAMIKPSLIRTARGHRGPEGWFEPDESGPAWLVFDEPENLVFWRPKTNEFAVWSGAIFALGGSVVDEPETYMFGCGLNIYPSPLSWLLAGRDGIVIINWSLAFDCLRECPRISICGSLLTTYHEAMRPRRLPELSCLRKKRRVA